MSYQLSSNIYSLSDLEINLNREADTINMALLEVLNSRTLTSIKNAFTRSIVVMNNGWIYVKVDELHHLLRTGNSGADAYYWQYGFNGYSSPSTPHYFGNEIYISGPDFCSLLEARIGSSVGKSHLYLKYVRAIYMQLTSLPIIFDLRSTFTLEIEERRSQLKRMRISTYGITCCEFTGQQFLNESDVDFAHVQSVATAPLIALNIDNGVIILKSIHTELTRSRIHDFAGMYDYCIHNNLNINWAENYNL